MNDIVDMSRFIEAKSDQLNADDLIGSPRTITVTKVTGNDGDQPISIHYQGDNGKPFKPCKTIRRVLMAIWGKYANEYVGKSMTVYRDDKVTFGGLDVGGIRISHMSGLDKETVVVVMKSKGKKAGMKILPLVNAPAATGLDRAQAEADLRNAASLDDLKAAWIRKAMAPHRDALASVLEERKAAFAFDDEAGPADEQRGETHTADQSEESRSNEMIRLIGTKVRRTDLDELMKSWRDETGGWDEATATRVNDAYLAQLESIAA